MTGSSISRKLTAIFYADVAGYSRLTGADEEGSHHRVMSALDLTTETIGDQGGSVLRYADDAVLAEFTSVVAAVQAAVSVQNDLNARNRNVPQDRKVQLRIGINLGEVMEDRGEIFGEGVNLAARLEAASEPGGLCVSSSVHEQVNGRIGIEFVDGGREQFKNISQPIHVYRWRLEPLEGEEDEVPPPTPADEVSAATPAKTKRSEKPSIAVLPFTNMSGDPE